MITLFYIEFEFGVWSGWRDSTSYLIPTSQFMNNPLSYQKVLSNGAKSHRPLLLEKKDTKLSIFWKPFYTLLKTPPSKIPTFL